LELFLKKVLGGVFEEGVMDSVSTQYLLVHRCLGMVFFIKINPWRDMVYRGFPYSQKTCPSWYMQLLLGCDGLPPARWRALHGLFSLSLVKEKERRQLTESRPNIDSSGVWK